MKYENPADNPATRAALIQAAIKQGKIPKEEGEAKMNELADQAKADGLYDEYKKFKKAAPDTD